MAFGFTGFISLVISASMPLPSVVGAGVGAESDVGAQADGGAATAAELYRLLHELSDR